MRGIQNGQIKEEPEEEAAGDDLYHMLNEIREMVRDVQKTANNNIYDPSRGPASVYDTLSHRPNSTTQSQNGKTKFKLHSNTEALRISDFPELKGMSLAAKPPPPPSVIGGFIPH
jgi:hypothetical protein